MDREEMLRQMLQAGASANRMVEYCARQSTQFGGMPSFETALLAAIRNGSSNAVKFLMKEGADPSVYGSMGVHFHGRALDFFGQCGRITDLAVRTLLEGEAKPADSVQTLAKRIKAKPELARKILEAEAIQNKIDGRENDITNIKAKADKDVANATAKVVKLRENAAYVAPVELAKLKKDSGELDTLLDAIDIATEKKELDQYASK